MRDDFCAFILTHGRPDKVLTYRTLRRAGYRGPCLIQVVREMLLAGWRCLWIRLSARRASTRLIFVYSRRK